MGYSFPSTTKPKQTLNIENFCGVDYASNPWEISVARSPDAVNLIPSDGGYPETRPGARELTRLEGRINGIWDYYTDSGRVRLVHHGDRISRWGVDNSTEVLYEGMRDVKSSAVQLRDKMLILDGGTALLVWQDEEDEDGAVSRIKITPLSERAYVPTTTVGRKPGERLGGSGLEAVNMIGNRRKNSFCVSETGATVLYMDSYPVKRFIKAEVLSENGIWTEVSYKSEDLTEGKLTFESLAITPVSGMDNYRVEFEVENLGTADKQDEFTPEEAERMDEEGQLVWTTVRGKEYWAKKYWFRVGEDLPREAVDAVIVTQNTYYEFVRDKGKDTVTKPKSVQYAVSITADEGERKLELGWYEDCYDESSDEVEYEPDGKHHLEMELLQKEGVWYLTVTQPHSSHGGGIGAIPKICELSRVVISRRSGTDDLYADKINGCTVAGVFGVGGNADRVFISGNKAHRNMDFMSGFEDVTYFPDTGYAKIGGEGSSVVGYSWLSDGVLAVHKEEAAGDSTIWYRSGALDDNGEAVFTLKQGAVGVGAVSPRCFAHFGTDNLMLSKQGVYAVTHAANEAVNERYAALRSWYINPKLCVEEDLSEAVAAAFGGRYYLAVNDRVYVADVGVGGSYERRGGGYQYDWWYWEGLPVRVWYTGENSLMFGTAEGAICVLDNSCYDLIGEESKPIECHWLTPVLDLGSKAYYKKIKNVYAIAEPYGRSSVRLGYILKGIESEIMDKRMSVFDFGDMDFSDMAFETDPMPRNLSSGAKIKKVMFIQFKLYNEPGRMFGLYGLTVLYTQGGKYKG